MLLAVSRHTGRSMRVCRQGASKGSLTQERGNQTRMHSLMARSASPDTAIHRSALVYRALISTERAADLEERTRAPQFVWQPGGALKDRVE